MKESYIEGLAAHNGPGSCVVAREGRGEALTGGRAGRVLSHESNLCHRADLRGADAVEVRGTLHSTHRQREMRRNPASPAGRAGRSQTPCMYGNTSRENRESPCPPAADGVAGRVGIHRGGPRTHADLPAGR